MSLIDSDLEEGEILDDSPPSPKVSPVVKKRKELPKRYIVRDKTNHKHKKDCKYAAHHHVQKPPKPKKSPSRAKTPLKKGHKPTCSHEKNKKSPKQFKIIGFSKHIRSKSDKSLPQLSLLAEMKSTFKDDLLSKLSSKLSKKPESVKILKKSSFDKNRTNDCKRIESHNAKIPVNASRNGREGEVGSDGRCAEKNSSLKQCDQPLKKDKDQSAPLKVDPHNNVENVSDNLNNSSGNKDEESEDEEELRRIALATFAKRKGQNIDNIPQASVTGTSGSEDDDIQIIHDTKNPNIQIKHVTNNANVEIVPETNNANVETVPETNNANVQIVQEANNANVQIVHEANNANVQIVHEANNVATDNYEVVDMEVDEDVQDSVDIIQTPIQDSAENLFVIDTNPSVDILGNKENALSESQAASEADDEFALDMLRAEIINSMAHKKFPPEEVPEKVEAGRGQQSTVMPKKKTFPNYRKPHTFYQRKPLQSVKHISRRNVNKLRNLRQHVKPNLHFQVNKPTVLPPVEVKKPPERLVIALNDDSSSDDSDQSDDNDAVPENPVESIVALISDCRQKSSENAADKPKEEVKKEVCQQDVPKAVSCLSKAQQEEYNSLKKILAKKTKMPPTQESEPPKNGSVYSPLNDLKVLEEKLVGMRDKLRNKKESITSLTKDEQSKKFQYMKAKLSAQHLREQFIAAEKIRKAKLLDWSEACNNLKVVKESISNLENKIGQVQNLCTKIGSTIKGKSYNLPLSPSTRQQPS